MALTNKEEHHLLSPTSSTSESPDCNENHDDNKDKTNGFVIKRQDHVSSRGCFTTPMFVANLSVLMLLNMTMIVYNISVVRTLEKRFSLSSTETGIMWSMNDLTHISIVTFVGYFGRRAHKPKVLSITMVFSAVAGIMMTMPYFLFPLSEEQYTSNATSPSNSGQPDDIHNLCTTKYSTDNTQDVSLLLDTCDSKGLKQELSDKHKAWYVFLFAQLLNGVGGVALQTLGLAYLDENSTKAKCSLYIGIVTSMYAFGPVGGLLLSAVALRFPENPLADTDMTPDDPMWIGCWWLGYAICSTAIILAITPMWFFPKHIIPPEEPEALVLKVKDREEERSTWSIIKHNIKGFFTTLMGILKNKAFITLLFMIVAMAYIIMGVFAQLVRYIEIHFMVPAFKAAIITAITAAGAGAVGGFLGGIVMTCLRLTPRGAAWMLCIAMGVTVGGLFGVMFMGCPQLEVGGVWDPSNNMLNVSTPCSLQCGCPEGEKSYQPICGADGISYFSPCHAGCSSFDNETYSGCTCLQGLTNSTISSLSNSFSGPAYQVLEGTATPGLCSLDCDLVIPFAVVIFIICLMGSSARVPGTILQFRLVKPEEKSFALGLISFAMNLLAMIPGPVLFGILIDKSCILWQQTCTGTGVCLFFNTEHFRFRTYGVTLGYELLSFFLSILLIFLVSKMTFALDGSDEEEIKVEEEENGDIEMKATFKDKLEDKCILENDM